MDHQEPTRLCKTAACTKKPLVDVSVLIIFFVRPDTLEKVFAQVKAARPSRLFLYQDGPRDGRPSDLENMTRCREIVRDIDWECDVQTFYQEKNMGCDPSEYIAQKWAFSHTDKCIVLEDDDVPSVSFFSFCKEMLDRYEHDERVMLISGMNFDEITPDVDEDYFFTTEISIWGWASWRRVIDKWDGGYAFLDDKLLRNRLNRVVDLNYAKNFVHQCSAHQRSGVAYYETILIANQYLNNGLTIVPRKNLILNVGMTDDATHFSNNIQDIPKGLRHVFSLKRYEMETGHLKHPQYMFDHVRYRERVFRTLGWRHPVIKAYRFVEVSCRRLLRGDVGGLWKDTVDKMKKLRMKTSSV